MECTGIRDLRDKVGFFFSGSCRGSALGVACLRAMRTRQQTMAIALRVVRVGTSFQNYGEGGPASFKKDGGHANIGVPRWGFVARGIQPRARRLERRSLRIMVCVDATE